LKTGIRKEWNRKNKIAKRQKKKRKKQLRRRKRQNWVNLEGLNLLLRNNHSQERRERPQEGHQPERRLLRRE